MKKYLIAICALLLIVSFSYSQIPDIVWQQCYGSPDTDYYQCILETDSGYLVGMGLSEFEPGISNYHGSHEIWLFKTDTAFNMEWERCYGGSAAETPIKLIKTNEGNYYIVGGTNSTDGDVQSFNNGSSDYWIVKINGSGEIIWEKCFGTSVAEGPRDALLTPDGGLLVMGRIHASGGDVSVYYGDNDVWLFKVDSLGILEWEKTLGNQYLDNGVTMIYNSLGNLLLIGAAAGHGGIVECYPDENWGDVWLLELDVQGNILNQYCYGGSDYDLGYLIIELYEGYAFIGTTDSNDGDVSGLHGPPGGPPSGWNDIWLVKLDEQMEIVWQKCLGGSNGDSPNYFTQTEDGGFIIMGITYSNNGDVSGNHSQPLNTDIWTVKLDNMGNIEWQRCFGSLGQEKIGIHSVVKRSDYNYVIAAETNFTSDDVQCTIHASMDYDTWLFEIDLEDTTSIYEDIVMQDNLRVYPNPAKDYVVFATFAKATVVKGELIILNIFGQEMARQPITCEKTVIDLRQWQTGVYFFRAEIDGINYSGKIMVQE